MKDRCDGAKYIKQHILKGYKLCFSHTKLKLQFMDMQILLKVKNSRVPGAIWKITKADEKELDGYEGVDYNYYSKHYLSIKRKKGFSIYSKYLLFTKTKLNLFTYNY